MGQTYQQLVEREWVSFPGGELEGTRPRTLCTACRERLNRDAALGLKPARPRALCFQCYRAELERDQKLQAAGQLDTATDARFQFALPLEPVNQPRLDRLRAERGVARAELKQGAGRFVDKRRQAQIAARHALQAVAAGLKARQMAPAARERALASAAHAAELQLPDAWQSLVANR